MDTYKLLNDEVLTIRDLSRKDKQFLGKLKDLGAAGTDYFEMLKQVKGKSAYPMRGGPITPAVATSILYRVAHDIADRVGIEQGYLLDQETSQSARTEYDTELLSMTEAADLIGMTRPATHQALRERRLPGTRIGNAWVIRRSDAQAYRKNRSSGAHEGSLACSE